MVVVVVVIMIKVAVEVAENGNTDKCIIMLISLIPFTIFCTKLGDT